MYARTAPSWRSRRSMAPPPSPVTVDSRLMLAASRSSRVRGSSPSCVTARSPGGRSPWRPCGTSRSTNSTPRRSATRGPTMVPPARTGPPTSRPGGAGGVRPSFTPCHGPTPSCGPSPLPPMCSPRGALPLRSRPPAGGTEWEGQSRLCRRGANIGGVLSAIERPMRVICVDAGEDQEIDQRSRSPISAADSEVGFSGAARRRPAARRTALSAASCRVARSPGSEPTAPGSRRAPARRAPVSSGRPDRRRRRFVRASGSSRRADPAVRRSPSLPRPAIGGATR